MRENLLIELLNNIELLNSIEFIEKDGQEVLKKNHICTSNGEETTSKKSAEDSIHLILEVDK